MLGLVEKGPKKDLIIFNLHQRIRYKVFCHIVARKGHDWANRCKKSANSKREPRDKGHTIWELGQFVTSEVSNRSRCRLRTRSKKQQIWLIWFHHRSGTCMQLVYHYYHLLLWFLQNLNKWIATYIRIILLNGPTVLNSLKDIVNPTDAVQDVALGRGEWQYADHDRCPCPEATP